MPASPRSRACRRRRGRPPGTQSVPTRAARRSRSTAPGSRIRSLFVTFADVASPFSFGTQYNFTATGDTKLTTHTVAQNPAVVDTQVCTVTDCSDAELARRTTSRTCSSSTRRAIRRSTRSRRPPVPRTGGTPVTITGENLGCVTNVSFGSVAAVDATNAAALLDCGSTDTVTVTAPAGKRRDGADHALDGRERRDRRAAPRKRRSRTPRRRRRRLTVQEVGQRLREGHELAGGYQLPEDVLAQVPLRQLGDPEGEGLQGLRLRRLVGRRSGAPGSRRARSRSTGTSRRPRSSRSRTAWCRTSRARASPRRSGRSRRTPARPGRSSTPSRAG